MGVVLSTAESDIKTLIGDRWFNVLDPRGLSGQFVLLMLWYLLSIGFSIWAIAALASQNVDATTPAPLGWFFPAFTSIVHIAMLILFLVFVEDYVLYPVKPRALYASFDAIICMSLGLSFGGLVANSLVLLIMTNGLLTVAFAGVAYKCYSMIADIDSRVRSAKTRALNPSRL